MKDTSRTAALDYLLAIGNLIALADHKEEQIMNLLEEKENIPAITSKPEEVNELISSINEEIAATRIQIKQLYDQRKTLQRNFFEIYDIDMDYWCQFKHYAVALTAMEECRNADDTVQNQILLAEFRKSVYQFLGVILWVWPANCWRCLADALDDDKVIRKSVVMLKAKPTKKESDDGIMDIKEWQSIPKWWHYAGLKDNRTWEISWLWAEKDWVDAVPKYIIWWTWTREWWPEWWNIYDINE